jgi:putative hydroxymethylpyrimidine transport system substrate-binding protein
VVEAVIRHAAKAILRAHMSWVAASLAAVALALGLAACGGDGAEPGASREATLVLDFIPNAVHAGIFAAEAEGYYGDEGIDVEIREPGASTDAPKLLEAGRADFAIMDIHDVTLAIERGADIGAVMPIVSGPLAAVIAGDRRAVKRPGDLEGETVGVTGLPSDDAVLDAVLVSDGADPDAVDRVTIGFDSVAALSAGRVDAATAFWNAEGVALRDLGVPTREFRAEDYGAPNYPELWLVTTNELARKAPALMSSMTNALERGSRLANRDPEAALDDLLAAVDGLEPGVQAAQLEALDAANAFELVHLEGTVPPSELIRWQVDHGILDEPISRDRFLAGH